MFKHQAFNSASCFLIFRGRTDRLCTSGEWAIAGMWIVRECCTVLRVCLPLLISTLLAVTAGRRYITSANHDALSQEHQPRYRSCPPPSSWVQTSSHLFCTYIHLFDHLSSSLFWASTARRILLSCQQGPRRREQRWFVFVLSQRHSNNVLSLLRLKK